MLTIRVEDIPVAILDPFFDPVERVHLILLEIQTVRFLCMDPIFCRVARGFIRALPRGFRDLRGFGHPGTPYYESFVS